MTACDDQLVFSHFFVIIVRIMIPLVINVNERPVHLRQTLQLAQQALGQIVAEK